MNGDHGQEKKVMVMSNGFENHDDNSLAIRVEDKGQDSGGGGGGHGNGNTEKVEEHLENVTGEMARLELPRARSKRVAALDAFRGLTIVIMILVDDAGEAYDKIDHSPWNGCTLADFVLPFFLFIVGVAIAFALKRVPRISDAMRKITIRTLKLLFWGILLQGGYSHAPDDLSYGVDMKRIRWMGILQRISLVYFVVAMIEALTANIRPTVLRPHRSAIFSAYHWQWLGGFVALIIYIITTYALYVPDWSFVFHNPGDINDGKRFLVQCGVRGHLGPACNAVGYIDRQVWGINHIYTQPVWRRSKDCTYDSPNLGPLRDDAPSWCLGPFEPEGLLSSVSAIVSGTIGVHYGHVLVHFKNHSDRLKQWLLMGLGLIIFAIIFHFTNAIPINKQLYSISYICFTAGVAGLVLSGFYILIDVWGLRAPFLFLEWIGMNAMLVFVLGAQGILAAFFNGWYYDKPNNSLVHWIHKHVFVDVWNSEIVGTLLYVLFAEIVFWGVFAGILHKLGIYWKL
ncbi:Heparan-alpha-glucosaminide N-acetyltransferase protein [Dioscorea alata]|uniref:Heparan-alpha-glucosaminide N-acetyltransferase protein n=1 Tax=Dioscorea alata TaxID=55571 RepID=A0ACB7W1J5_DIOAL|nr:Heparan-alpha-glucosaminide N-acetyltransferase protein [Dioscorea alata]